MVKRKLGVRVTLGAPGIKGAAVAQVTCNEQIRAVDDRANRSLPHGGYSLNPAEAQAPRAIIPRWISHPRRDGAVH